MFSLVRVMKFGAAAIFAAVLLAGASAGSWAAHTKMVQPKGAPVQLKIFKAGLVIGGGSGGGVLTFHGKKYKLGVDGVDVGTIGIAEAHLVGNAYNLRRATDIAGTYDLANASIAIGGGSKVARLENGKGVVLELSGEQTGLEATLGLGGMTISLVR
jgi:hypothetical protein